MNEQKLARFELNENDVEYRPDIQSLLCAWQTIFANDQSQTTLNADKGDKLSRNIRLLGL